MARLVWKAISLVYSIIDKLGYGQQLHSEVHGNIRVFCNHMQIFISSVYVQNSIVSIVLFIALELCFW